jgi:hypothetical protein
MCDRSGKLKQSKSNKPVQHTKKCDCTWGVWIEQCEEGWTTVEPPKKARERSSQSGATMATVHNHTLILSVSKVDTNAQNNCAGGPPAKKQRTSSVPMSFSAATPSSLRTFLPIYAPPSHKQLPLLLPPYFNVPRYTIPPSFQRPQSHQRYPGAPFLPVLNPNLPASASVRVAYHPARQLTVIFGFTPFGIYCRFCNDHVGSTQQRIKAHLESKGHGLFSKDAVSAFETVSATEIEKLLMSSKQANLDEFLVGRSEGFACRCQAVFGDMRALTRHCKETKSCSFDPKDAKPELLHKTVCGRTVSQATLERLSAWCQDVHDVSQLSSVEH